MACAIDFEEYRRADMRFHIGIAEAASSPRLVAAMTEVQGQMSDLIAQIAHPERVLTHSNAQHRRLVTLLRKAGLDARSEYVPHGGHTDDGAVGERARQVFETLLARSSAGGG